MKKIIIFFLSLHSVLVFSQVHADYQLLGEQSKSESLNPVRPGIPGKQAFWNEKASMFIYAPSFNFNNSSWIIPETKYYRYSAFSFKDNKTYSFTANTPFESLAQIWNKLPIGEVYLKVEAVSPDEQDFVLAGSRLFHKTASFSPPYPEPKYSIDEAFQKGLQFQYNQPHIKQWLLTGRPDHSKHQLYCYSALEVGSVINIMLLYNKYFPDNDTALVIAKKAADYLILNAEPKGVTLEYFPQVYEGSDLNAGNFVNEIIMTEPASTGKSYLDLYERTNEKKYFEAAERIANTYLKTQLPTGTWHIRINKKTGNPASEELCIPINISGFLSVLVEKYKLIKYQKAIDSAIDWIWENPVKTFNWTGQFEDVAAVKPYQNLSKYEASWFAQYLLNNLEKDSSYLFTAKELIAFCEDQFVVWENPGIYDNWGNASSRWHTPAVLEQYHCYVPIDASVVQMVNTFYLAYKKTDEVIYREKAIALANSLINTQHDDGMIPTFWVPGFTEFWNNCMVSS
ncbi:MAG: hypothetical protein V2A57_04820, partial [Elusimicrobiota bacterium]